MHLTCVCPVSFIFVFVVSCQARSYSYICRSRPDHTKQVHIYAKQDHTYVRVHHAHQRSIHDNIIRSINQSCARLRRTVDNARTDPPPATHQCKSSWTSREDGRRTCQYTSARTVHVARRHGPSSVKQTNKPRKARYVRYELSHRRRRQIPALRAAPATRHRSPAGTRAHSQLISTDPYTGHRP